ncbi:HAD-like domain-containing protein [Mycena sanguinolenta]|nr:HAD-like domain-containing protein [Mycena sanguinolenta]
MRLVPKIRLVSFDVLHTLIAPHPIHVQYARAFEPYLGALNPDAIKDSFRIAIGQLRTEKPVYGNDSNAWWSEVIRRTALGAGAEPKVLEKSLTSITPRLMKMFSSKDGYKLAFDDSLSSVVHALHNELGVQTAVVSNGDSRFVSVLQDLDFPDYLKPIILSESEGIEKPSPKIFHSLLHQINVELETPITPAECVHVGDELVCDYYGAQSAGLHALLLNRPGNQRDAVVVPKSVDVVDTMDDVLQWVRARS